MSRSLPSIEQPPEQLPVVVFAIADYQLALPLKAVLKITPCPPQTNQVIDLLDLEGHAIHLLDLHRQLTPKSSPTPHQFLLLLQTPAAAQCGIPLAALPNMTTLAMSTIQRLPTTAQGTPLGQVCRYVSLQRQGGSAQRLIFLLDLGLVLPDGGLEIAIGDWDV